MSKIFNDIDFKDVAIRSLKTFIEAVLTYIVTALGGITYGDGSLHETVTIGLLFCALCAGITAVINGVILPLCKSDEKTDE